MWFIGVEVEQETSALPPKKNPESAPDVRYDLNVIKKSKLPFWPRGFGFDDRFVGHERYS